MANFERNRSVFVKNNNQITMLESVMICYASFVIFFMSFIGEWLYSYFYMRINAFTIHESAEIWFYALTCTAIFTATVETIGKNLKNNIFYLILSFALCEWCNILSINVYKSLLPRWKVEMWYFGMYCLICVHHLLATTINTLKHMKLIVSAAERIIKKCSGKDITKNQRKWSNTILILITFVEMICTASILFLFTNMDLMTTEIMFNRFFMIIPIVCAIILTCIEFFEIKEIELPTKFRHAFFTLTMLSLFIVYDLYGFYTRFPTFNKGHSFIIISLLFGQLLLAHGRQFLIELHLNPSKFERLNNINQTLPFSLQRLRKGTLLSVKIIREGRPTERVILCDTAPTITIGAVESSTEIKS